MGNKSLLVGGAGSSAPRAHTHDAPGQPRFSQPGAVTVATSGRETVRQAGGVTLTEVFASVATTGSTSTGITVRKNGTSIGTFTIAASANTGSVTLSEAFALNDYLTIEVTSAGTGAEKLVVQGTWA